ncbi:ESX secretion-associated protein EspG [Mycolicibacterium flavescens]|uniref:Secretion protein EspG n=1 Tax=Mycolicibacterium flavescens TaxID=1776 RepID=A0A1E3RNU1_MYCFV|nr:ESX secretion-associated protein EspG [Mycolicibacterium flavescens]MCV7281518.1 ESX secretion-associated protein EspG [Mycolicibacterium flavescens]ODQ91566.1 secretion protein EspG [Mycolicibacterium flavescens]
MAANAVELTAEQAWFVADRTGVGGYPWVLAVTPPYSDLAARGRVETRLTAELVELGVMSADGTVNNAVRQWVTTTCRARRWLELRFVRGAGSMLRGHVGRRDDATVVALRSGGLVTLTALDLHHPQALVPVLTAGLSGRAPARFDEFAIPARIGARADEQLRNGAELAEVIEFLGVPPSARAVVEAAYSTDRSYVEVVAGDHRDGHRISTDVGVSVVDTREGRVLVHPSKAFDGEWVSTFTPGTPHAIATAVERLTATLPDGVWFPDVTLTRDFDSQHRTEHQWQTVQ